MTDETHVCVGVCVLHIMMNFSEKLAVLIINKATHTRKFFNSQLYVRLRLEKLLHEYLFRKFVLKIPSHKKSFGEMMKLWNESFGYLWRRKRFV